MAIVLNVAKVVALRSDLDDNLVPKYLTVTVVFPGEEYDSLLNLIVRI